MFNQELIDRLFAEDRDLMTVTPDSKWVIYKFNRSSQYEIRVESNYETRHRFYLAINEDSKNRLINHLKNLGLIKEDEIL